MEPLEIQEIEARVAVKRLLDKKGGAIELFIEILETFKEKEHEISRRESDIWIVVKNIKPEYLDEMKKLIIPEVFERLGL